MSDVVSHSMGLNEAARCYEVPKATIKRYSKLNSHRNAADNEVKKLIAGRNTDLPGKLENSLVEHINSMEEHGFGLTRIDVRKMALELAVRNNIKCRFNLESELTGIHLHENFMK